MAEFTGARPPDQYNKFDSPLGYEWASRLTNFVQGLATQPDLSGVFRNQQLKAGQIIVGPNGFKTLVEIEKFSKNSTDIGGIGGNTALFIQHFIDSSTATVNKINAGIRVQVESYQTSTASLNDLVCYYGGIYQGGANIGGFGYHLDLYYAGSGASSTMYGVNIEMNRNNSTGVLVGYHLRVIQSTFSTIGTDYGFLISPSVGGNNPVTTGFSVGSSVFGTIPCTVCFDSAYATSAIGLRVATAQAVQWNGTAGTISTQYDGTFWSITKSGTLWFGINMADGTVNAGGLTTATAGALGGYWVVNINGSLVKIPIYATS